MNFPANRISFIGPCPALLPARHEIIGGNSFSTGTLTSAFGLAYASSIFFEQLLTNKVSKTTGTINIFFIVEYFELMIVV